MKSSERDFWTKVAQSMNPDWEIRLGANWMPGEDGGSNDFYVYAIDMTTGWVCLAGMNSAEAHRMIDVIGTNEPELKAAPGFAAQAISDVALLPEDRRQQEQEVAMIATTMALSTTKSFKLANPGKSGFTTHCLYLSYKANDASYIGRPAVIQSRNSGAVSPADLLRFVRQIVQADTGSGESSEVARMIIRCGGTNISKDFR